MLNHHSIIPAGSVRSRQRGVTLLIALILLVAMTAAERAELGRHGQQFLDANRSRTAMAARLQALLDELRPAETGSPRAHKEMST